MIAHNSLVMRSVIAEVCQRCCKIPCADNLDASRLHDILRQRIVQQYGGVCPPVCVKPMLILTERIGGCCHLPDRKQQSLMEHTVSMRSLLVLAQCGRSLVVIINQQACHQLNCGTSYPVHSCAFPFCMCQLCCKLACPGDVLASRPWAPHGRVACRPLCATSPLLDLS